MGMVGHIAGARAGRDTLSVVLRSVALKAYAGKPLITQASRSGPGGK